MKLNSNTRLVLKDIYLYDIEACHYSVMQKLGLDMSGINKEDKSERNIQIGKMMNRNPKLIPLLRNTTKSIINEYIRANQITHSDIIIRQYDGIILKKTLHITDLGVIPLNRRKHFLIFISSIDRTRYIALDSENEIIVKGVSHKYDEMNKIYEQMCKINYNRKGSIFRNLQRIKDYIMTTQNTSLFAVPSDSSGRNFNIFIKDYGQIPILKSFLTTMDVNDIDRETYFNVYIAPFTKSIVINHIR